MVVYYRVITVFLIVLLVVSCNKTETELSPDSIEPTPGLTQPPGRCGDGLCDGPENPKNCPEDCTATVEAPIEETDERAFRRGPEEDTYWVINQTNGNRLFVRLVHPEGWSGGELPVLVLVPGGSGDSTDFLGAPRYTASKLANEGYLVVVFDPDGRGQSEGEEDYNGYLHQDGLAYVIRFAASSPDAEMGQMGLISFSYGVTMAAGTLARYPELPVAFLADWEGPADRNDTGGCDEDHRGHLQDVVSCTDETFWAEHEALTFISDIEVPYQRLQSQKDHAQPDNDHAIAMVNAAIAGSVPWVRLNDLPPNQTYDMADPPPMLPDSQDRDLAALLIPYLEELFTSAE
jgi:pimeloyl-ACP methyl ester carboxylesterase